MTRTLARREDIVKTLMNTHMRPKAEYLADRQIAAMETYDKWKDTCWQRSSYVQSDGTLLYTVCLCPTGLSEYGVGCTIDRSTCRVAKKWDKALAEETERQRQNPRVRKNYGDLDIDV